MKKVFVFTFCQRCKSRVYKNVTILGALLCFFLPALILPAVEYFEKDGAYESRLTKVYVIDKDAQHPADYRVLNSADEEQFRQIAYETAEDLQEAAQMAEADKTAALLVVEAEDEAYQIQVLLPENTELSGRDAEGYEEFISRYFRYILAQKSRLAAGQIAQLTAPVEVSLRDAGGAEDETDEFAQARRIFSYLLPYLNIMILYFMVLAYGQGMANSAIMEKTSKLMDLFLVSVKPEAMLLGKVFAEVAGALLQIFIWIAALCGGFAAGAFLVRQINPQTDMMLLQLFASFGSLSGMFAPSGIALALVMLAAGFLLYCALAAIGGAVAEKPEDLSSTNMLFILALLLSFFAVLYAGGMDSDIPWASATWQVWVPFTAILVVPAKVLIGSMPVWQAALSAGIVIVTAAALTVLAGKLYRMMSLYKGNPPGPGELLRMLKQTAK